MNHVLTGVINGNVIELSADPGLGEGQSVEVVVRVTQPKRPWGEGLRACAGAFANDPESDADWDEIARMRHMTQPSSESVEEKIRRLAGSAGDDPDDDRILEEIYRGRHSSKSREVDR